MKPILSYITNPKREDKIPIYGAKKIKIGVSEGSIVFNDVIFINNTLFNQITPLEFPVINNKSPMYLTIKYVSQENITIRLLIEEFGGTPSETYFEDGA